MATPNRATRSPPVVPSSAGPYRHPAPARNRDNITATSGDSRRTRINEEVYVTGRVDAVDLHTQRTRRIERSGRDARLRVHHQGRACVITRQSRAQVGVHRPKRGRLLYRGRTNRAGDVRLVSTRSTSSPLVANKSTWRPLSICLRRTTQPSPLSHSANASTNRASLTIGPATSSSRTTSRAASRAERLTSSDLRDLGSQRSIASSISSGTASGGIPSFEDKRSISRTTVLPPSFEASRGPSMRE